MRFEIRSLPFASPSLQSCGHRRRVHNMQKRIYNFNSFRRRRICVWCLDCDVRVVSWSVFQPSFGASVARQITQASGISTHTTRTNVRTHTHSRHSSRHNSPLTSSSSVDVGRGLYVPRFQTLSLRRRRLRSAMTVKGTSIIRRCSKQHTHDERHRPKGQFVYTHIHTF